MASLPSRAGNYLSIDGGINPSSALYIIDEMLQRLRFDIKSKEDIRACDWFDLIIGSGYGGIIALLLGRLNMTITQAIKAFNSLAAMLPTEPAETKQEREANRTRFVDMFEIILKDMGYSVDSLMRIGSGESSSCHVALCALDSLNATSCQFIRSYATRGMTEPQCTILQAACATIASPNTYEPVIVGDGDDRIVYIDAMAGYANPTNEMLKEAEKAFGRNATVATIISIGSGGPEGWQKTQGSVSVQLTDILRRTMLDTERVHNDLQNRFHDHGIYYRFNANSYAHFNELVGSTTRATTKAFLDKASTNQRMDQAISSIRERKEGKILNDINSIPIIEMKYRQRPGVVPFFVGRQDILGHLHRNHRENPRHEGDYPTVSVLTGLGGSGKTQIALQFARQFETINPGILSLFIDASSKDRIEEDYQAISRSRGIAHRSSTYENAIQWLANAADQWLIIADNADDPDFDLYPYIPRCRHGHFIITSRNANQALMARINTYHIEALDVNNSVKLLLDVSGYESIDFNIKAATSIVSALGHLPLAIVQAAGYIFKNQCLSTYLKLYYESVEKFLAHRAKELPHGYNLSVATTLEMSFNKLPIRSKQALCVFSFLHNASIAHSIIETAAENKFFYASGKASEADRERLDEIQSESDALCKIFCPGDQWSESEFYELIEPCFQYSLLQRVASADGRKFYSMHILVQSWLQTRPIPNDQFSSRSLARRMLLAIVQEGQLYQHFSLHQSLRPHLKGFTGQPLNVANDDALVYRVLSDCGDNSTAMIHIVSYVNRLNIKVEPNTVERLKALQDLTWILMVTGRTNEAVKAGEEAVALCKNSLGKDNPVLLMCMINLAAAYRDARRYKEAHKLEEEASEWAREAFGIEHIITLNAMTGLALDYKGLGDIRKALNLHQKMLALYPTVWGPEHPETLVAMANLATYYHDLGEYEKSRDLNEEVLGLFKRILGTEHTDTLILMGNIAENYRQLGEYEKARNLNEEVLALGKRILGPEHPYTLDFMSILAQNYMDLQCFEEGQKILDEKNEIEKKKNMIH
ncbi:hypothetical protein CPB86DRAFT_741455 [Serendipita vermifera]|nr:hypothetical protein CPB86DRAFT_741455 [Serendipita vermifera]